MVPSEKTSGSFGASLGQRGPDSYRSDAVFCLFILAVCLIYNAHALFTYFASISEGILDFAGRPIGRDFINYWTGGHAVFDGMYPDIFDVSLYHPYQERLLGTDFADHNWSYPPHILLLLWPLGLLPYVPALVLWSIVTLSAYLWACLAFSRLRWPLVPALLLAPATFICLTGGQNGFLTGALLIGGFGLLRRHPVLAGVLFGILTIKPQLGILIPFALLAARQWTAIASASLTAAALVGGSVFLFGAESWKAYFDLVAPLQTMIMNEGRGSFLTMMPSAYIGLRLLGVEQDLRTVVQALLAIGALAAVLWVFARSRDWSLQLAVLAVGTFIASPYAFNYDMTTVSLAVALVALRGLDSGFLPGERIVLAVTWLLPITVQWMNAVGVPLGTPILATCFVYLLLRVRAGIQSVSVTQAGRSELALQGD